MAYQSIQLVIRGGLKFNHSIPYPELHCLQKENTIISTPATQNQAWAGFQTST